MDRVELIINAGKISSRIKFFLQDVVELRNVLYASVSLFVCVCVCVYIVSVYVFLCVCVCLYVYMFMHCGLLNVVLLNHSKENHSTCNL